MNLLLRGPKNKNLNTQLNITGSKSETNRLLLLQAIYPNLSLKNLSVSDDGEAMAKGLGIESGTVDIHHAGTAMRFLTAFFASQEGKEIILTGSKRMQERPIKVLVEALIQLGAEIDYVENDGFPPIKIVGKNLSKKKVSLPANISSQYISALLLIAPSLQRGLELELIGKITSVPYIKMTLALLDQIGVSSQFSGNSIKVLPCKSVKDLTITVESDWSSASYFYSLIAMSDVGSNICLSSYKTDSLQGDSILTELYTFFGVETVFEDDLLYIHKKKSPEKDSFSYDLTNAPDLAQTVAATCFGLGMSCNLIGLHTLKIKETDRLVAMENELTKLGAKVSITDFSLTLAASKIHSEEVSINTYNDHRMAMAFAPLALLRPLKINDAEVVSKSYPNFWKDFQQIGFITKEV
ncbi:3-phosphoshikimate 1-carboxyvinyltransferase [Eudoraea chungangensis]|uniref:3-phosphoshikimate 1-carboxyvinyltransferase n=1 Tax=Eudoraea chungangensis TaxID=1481905 RepID=UPI0023ED6664|nr:3-phosphoshikimate 1-carboxyvinyltransferase [Eudoraea chungangensis]